MSDTDQDGIRRVSSGWGRRAPKQRVDPSAVERDAERARPLDEDLEQAAAAGAISGRAATRETQDLASGDTLGGAIETGDEAGESDANMAQSDPLSGNPPQP